MKRFLFALKMAWVYFSSIRDIRRDLTKQAHTICNINVTQLKQKGIKALILDFDGVLSAYAEIKPREEVSVWLHKAIAVFGVHRVIILTNKPFLERKNYVAHQFPGLAMPCYPKKPYPDGLIALANQLKLEPKSLLMVDDRLLTGVLAGLIADTQVIWITKAYFSFRKKPIKELGFIILRFMEKIIFI